MGALSYHEVEQSRRVGIDEALAAGTPVLLPHDL
jgi:hypothetical protein